MRILVVDDDPDIVLVCAMNLKADGHEVISANDGLAGLDLATSASPDALVLNVKMGGLDGLSVLRELRQRPETREIPVVLLTGRVRKEDQLLGWLAGADGYQRKPFLPYELVQTIERVATSSSDERSEHRARMLAALLEQPSR